MKRSLAHLPEHKQRELNEITNIIKAYPGVEMVILFGSYARGDWVEDKQAGNLDPRFLPVFPRTTPEERRLFELLKKAYIDARYNRSYKITRKELEYLTARVKKLQEVTKKVCKEKIKSYA